MLQCTVWLGKRGLYDKQRTHSDAWARLEVTAQPYRHAELDKEDDEKCDSVTTGSIELDGV